MWKFTTLTRINFHKSKVRYVEIYNFENLVYVKCLNCRQMKISFKCLGMFVGDNIRKSTFWNFVVDKIRTRLSIWKDTKLFMTGQICLIMLVIIVLSLYDFSFFKATTVVYNQIRRIQAKFLWGWDFEDRKIAWVKWDKVCSPVEAGGLEIKDIRYFNDALLAKCK